MLKIALLVWCAVCVQSQTVKKSVSVRGQVLCGDHPATDARLRLFLYKQSTFTSDLVDSQHPGATGTFLLQATVEEPIFTDQKFRLTIFHKCDDTNQDKGFRLFRLQIPDHYVSDGTTALNVYDVGNLNLQAIFPGEERDGTPDNATETHPETGIKRSNEAISVKGELYCGGRALTGVKVRLFSKYTDGTTMTHQIDHTRTGVAGAFQVEGFTEKRGEKSIFEPTIKIYHNCADPPKKTQQRVVTLKIPKKYITLGRYAFNNYDVGKLNMEAIYPNERRESIAVSHTQDEVAQMLFNKI